MDLVEGALAEERDELDTGCRAGPAVEVVVDQAATRQVEALVEAAQLVPQLARQEERAALAHRSEPTAR